MFQRFSSGIFLFLLIPTLILGIDKEKKAYELIYKDVQILKQQIQKLDKEISYNREDIQTIRKHLEELLSLSRLSQKEQARYREEQKKLPGQYQILLEKLDIINTQFARLSEELIELKRTSIPATEQAEKKEEAKPEEQQPPPEKESEEQKKEEATEDEPPQIPTNFSPQEVYNMAYSDYLKGNFQLAIDGFEIYLQQFPESPVADNALYWVGECYFSQQKFEESIEKFSELILNYPQGDKIPAAYLKKGISLMEIGKKEEALSAFKLLISKFPLEEETKIAQEKIKELVKANERYK